jgi:hypothetical protein
VLIESWGYKVFVAEAPDLNLSTTGKQRRRRLPFVERTDHHNLRAIAAR